MLAFYIFTFSLCLKDDENSPQEITQSVGITPNEAKVISSNPPPLLCEHVKKKKKRKIVFNK